MIDWLAHYGALYGALGSAAVLTPDDGSGSVEITAIDHTTGEAVGDSIEVATILPVAYVRMSELTDYGITRAQVKGAFLALNGHGWRVKASIPKPSGAGESQGELKLILSDEYRTS